MPKSKVMAKETLSISEQIILEKRDEIIEQLQNFKGPIQPQANV